MASSEVCVAQHVQVGSSGVVVIKAVGVAMAVPVLMGGTSIPMRWRYGQRSNNSDDQRLVERGNARIDQSVHALGPQTGSNTQQQNNAGKTSETI